jgi:hypothetical protein
MFVVVVILLLLHHATCETPSSCDIHGPQDSVVFNNLTQANGIDWLDRTVWVQNMFSVQRICTCMCSFAAHCTRSAHICARCLAKEHSKCVQHAQNVQQKFCFRTAVRSAWTITFARRQWRVNSPEFNSWLPIPGRSWQVGAALQDRVENQWIPETGTCSTHKPGV